MTDKKTILFNETLFSSGGNKTKKNKKKEKKEKPKTIIKPNTLKELLSSKAIDNCLPA